MKSREIFLSQPILLELEAPLKICGKSGRMPLLRPQLGLGPVIFAMVAQGAFVC
jgi:hypothetical protein